LLALPAAGAEEFPASIATPGWTLQDVLLDPVSCGSILSTQLQLQPFSFLSQKLVGFVTSCDGLIEKRRNSNRQTGLPKNEKTSLRFQLISISHWAGRVDPAHRTSPGHRQQYRCREVKSPAPLRASPVRACTVPATGACLQAHTALLVWWAPERQSSRDGWIS
jgi:hypothetical protein